LVEKLKSIWMDGKFVDWDDAKVHVLTHAFHYGTGAFEGIRAYQTQDGRSAVFRLKEHIRRLVDSCKILMADLPYDFETVCQACKETLAVNGLRAGYVRPLAYIGEGTLSVFPGDNPTHLMIAAWKWGAYLGEKALKEGVRAKTSSYQRPHPNSVMTRAKITGNYVTGVLAKREAKRLGYDECVLLDTEGFVAEGSGENIFVVRDGVLLTTPLTSILPGITRKTVIQLARDMGYTVEERRFSRDGLYIADEAFFCGTAAEVTPIREVDDRAVGEGKPGPVTKRIQRAFFDVVKGADSRYAEWLDPYEVARPAAAKASG